MNRHVATAVIGTVVMALTACGSDSEPAVGVAETVAPLSTENTGSDFCMTFAALDSSNVFLHAAEDTIRPGLELQIEQMEELRSTLPSELADVEKALDIQLAAARATLDIYAANGFDSDAVSADPSYGAVSETIGASMQADVINATSDAREYCGIEL